VDNWSRQKLNWAIYGYNMSGINEFGHCVLVVALGQQGSTALNKVLRKCKPGDVIKLTDVCIERPTTTTSKLFSATYSLNKQTECTVLGNLPPGSYAKLTPVSLPQITGDPNRDEMGFITAAGFEALAKDTTTPAQNIMVRTSNGKCRVIG